ncbi:hypothetical protein [Pseudovibrio sp. Tun.PSC04-5.I4]|uniref:hypothetical protein n=1 Tax=Pseudovibrio sp. Tun.PSC04-5.I4 TaxID=1798213 RepID=UPI00088D9778|nr:hypothetical protein [Pseudovibrio sp. Tun.PSC04-5.I4]SDR20230.1 hypothetical protein SAMN04515695_3371 [Pseudovibrio sp. Tun.PSC04-5.I4]
MNSIDNDAFSDRCNVPLFLFCEAMKLAIIAITGIALLNLVPALNETSIKAKAQSIPTDFITTQITSFEANGSHR